MNEYKKMYSMKRIDHTLRFYNIRHAAEKIIYRDYGMPKKYDVLFISLAHKQFKEMSHNQFEKILTKKGFILM